MPNSNNQNFSLENLGQNLRAKTAWEKLKEILKQKPDKVADENVKQKFTHDFFIAFSELNEVYLQYKSEEDKSEHDSLTFNNFFLKCEETFKLFGYEKDDTSAALLSTSWLTMVKNIEAQAASNDSNLEKNSQLLVSMRTFFAHYNINPNLYKSSIIIDIISSFNIGVNNLQNFNANTDKKEPAYITYEIAYYDHVADLMGQLCDYVIKHPEENLFHDKQSTISKLLEDINNEFADNTKTPAERLVEIIKKLCEADKTSGELHQIISNFINSCTQKSPYLAYAVFTEIHKPSAEKLGIDLSEEQESLEVNLPVDWLHSNLSSENAQVYVHDQVNAHIRKSVERYYFEEAYQSYKQTDEYKNECKDKDEVAVRQESLDKFKAEHQYTLSGLQTSFKDKVPSLINQILHWLESLFHPNKASQALAKFRDFPPGNGHQTRTATTTPASQGDIQSKDETGDTPATTLKAK